MTTVRQGNHDQNQLTIGIYWHLLTIIVATQNNSHDDFIIPEIIMQILTRLREAVYTCEGIAGASASHVTRVMSTFWQMLGVSVVHG